MSTGTGQKKDLFQIGRKLESGPTQPPQEGEGEMALGNWKKEAPTEPGPYWFYGSILGERIEKPIIVSIADSNFAYLIAADGSFYTRDFSGLWTGPILPPELPPQEEQG